MLSAESVEASVSRKEEARKEKIREHVDDRIIFSNLAKSDDPSHSDDIFQLSMSMAVDGSKKESSNISASKLSKVCGHFFSTKIYFGGISSLYCFLNQ